jgi:hypothetical protein
LRVYIHIHIYLLALLAEFRSKWLWSSEALKPYRYMIWIDSDAFATRPWKQDPIATMVRNNLVVLFDNLFTTGDGGPEMHKRIRNSFGRTICGISLGAHGEMVTIPTNEHTGLCGDSDNNNKKNNNNPYPMVQKIHGFFHITDLQFYRSPTALKWYDTMIGDSKYSRKWDDQMSVTLPAAMMAPNRSWDMRQNGLSLYMMHNGEWDGKEWTKLPHWYMSFWENATNFPEARPMCKDVVVSGGRRRRHR